MRFNAKMRLQKVADEGDVEVRVFQLMSGRLKSPTKMRLLVEGSDSMEFRTR